MSNRTTRSVIAAAILLTLGALLFPGALKLPFGFEPPDSALALKAPPFLEVAYAQEEPEDASLGAKLDQEAGISAYFKSIDPINLDQVRASFRTIEMETANYIIGSIGVPNYPEQYDAHVYVHRDGWILAYYLKDDPASKIADVRGELIQSTNLKTAVSIVASAAGAAFTDVTYYDFRYPNATHLLLVGENDDDGNSFNINLPSEYGYYERSWAQKGYAYDFVVDGVNYGENPLAKSSNYAISYGILTASQLLPATTHQVSIGVPWNTSDYGVLAITYRMP